MPKEIFPEHEERAQILCRVYNAMLYGGLSRDEFNKLKNKIIAPGWSIGQFVQVELNFGEVKWIDDKLKYIESTPRK
jgi:hypothetical protein